jgi:hypothetical protein
MKRIHAACILAVALPILPLQPAAARQALPGAARLAAPAGAPVPAVQHQEAPPAAAAPQQDPPIPAGKQAKIREILRLTGSGQMGTMVVHQMITALKPQMAGVPESFWQEFMEEVKPAELEELVVPIYARHFSEAELQGLIDFYSSPLGRKVVGEMPQVLQESVAAGQVWGRQLAERVLARAKAKGYKIET